MTKLIVRGCAHFLRRLDHWNYPHRNIQTVSTLKRRHDSECFNYESKYSENEEIKIFAKLNMSSAEELSKLAISEHRLKGLLNRRSKGAISSFSDILEVAGLGIKGLENMCDSILNESNNANSLNKSKTKNKIKGQILDPLLDSDQNKLIKSACGLIIDLKCVSWARIDRFTNRLTDWKTFDFGVRDGKRLRLSNIMEMVWTICQSIPPSDVYVMEASSTVIRSAGADANNPKSVHINLQKSQLVAMLASAITIMGNSPLSDTDSKKNVNEYEENLDGQLLSSGFQHKVFYLRSTLPSRLFRTFVGNEKVSSQSIVGHILNGDEELSECDKITQLMQSITPLQVGTDIRHIFYQQMDVEKEILCQTLLLCVTFMELCVYKNSRVINTLGNSRND